MTVDRDKITDYCVAYLHVNRFKDGCINGLQVEGAARITRIVTGVSLSYKLIEAARKSRAEMIMVHHGIFSSSLPQPPVIRGVLKNRLAALLAADISLLGFHLPLDAHPVIGNNASLLRILGIRKKGVVETPAYGPIGLWGSPAGPAAVDTLIRRLKERLGSEPYVIRSGPQQVRRVAVISGGASPDVHAAARLGVDTYVTGDIRENIVREVEELGVNFINAGHYNTEKAGIRNLGDLVAKRFGIAVDFVDIPNEI